MRQQAPRANTGDFASEPAGKFTSEDSWCSTKRIALVVSVFASGALFCDPSPFEFDLRDKAVDSRLPLASLQKREPPHVQAAGLLANEQVANETIGWNQWELWNEIGRPSKPGPAPASISA